ncbi:hypothetical protein [Micromonospora sp. NPDC003816]|uniref:hypothetical protein n=1 Tax=Micromonospora sp. NPDC003816 TaxID=3364224 RepID=UPI003686C6A1
MEVVLSILLGLFVNEAFDISPWLARRLVRWSAYRWTTDPEIAAGYAEEWAAIIDQRPGKLFKLLTAVQFTFGAAGRAAPRAVMRALIASRLLRAVWIYALAFIAMSKVRGDASNESLDAAVIKYLEAHAGKKRNPWLSGAKRDLLGLHAVQDNNMANPAGRQGRAVAAPTRKRRRRR